MIKSKKRQFQYPTTRTAAAAAPRVTDLRLKDYVLLNVLFDAFCLMQLVIIRTIMTDMTGMYFFFLFIMCAFFIVSAFDYVSSHLVSGAGTPTS